MADKTADELQVEDASVAFEGIHALDHVSLQVSSGEILGVIGPNGAGKTTLVNVVTGFQAPDSGRVLLSKQLVTRMPPWRRARAGLARTFQSVMLFPQLTVVENVEAGALAMGVDRRTARNRALDVLQWLDLSALADKLAATLPFGAERKVGIGRVLTTGPKFLLMDEPAAGLNDMECEELAQLIRRIRRDLGAGILLIEHRMSLVFALCDRIQVLAQGRTIAADVPEVIRRHGAVRDAYLGTGV